jgi:hypothetical protein
MITWLQGKKTYLAAAGLFGLALYDVSIASYAAAWLAVTQALSVAGTPRRDLESSELNQNHVRRKDRSTRLHR